MPVTDKTHHWEAQTLEEKQDKHVFSPSILCTQFSTNNLGRSFGQERPPLTDLLKNILERYPDGGQILKELIQNADDAGANEVKVLFDATSYGTASLVSPELALFQGPALYCYNNAEFTDEDWEGLQRLMRSNKQNNPLKVGRFGIGFNSVYHITDLPSIASGDTVAFLDPHEKYFVRGQPGQAFSTEQPLLAENFDQFEPFHQIFDCNLSQGNHYNGTLFRFPLRTQPSQLSNKIYTKDMVQTLFDSFKNEASAILLFLKNIDTIGLYEREERGKVFHLYTAKVSEKSRNEVRKRRQELIQNITLEWDFAVKTTFYRLEIEKECPEKPTEKNDWFLANQVGTNEKKLIELARNLKLLPWIGIAFPVDANNNMSSLGRIFCFLPLPPDCRTGLPVQMNGYFGLTDNRRALKWPGPDCQNDETAQWNQLLLEKVGSQVYANLIVNMTRENSGKLSSELLAQLVYSAFPVHSNVREEWRCILQLFFRTVLTKEIFFTTARGNSRWVTLGEAVIDRLDESKGMRDEIKQVVLHTLLSAGQPIVSLPTHVIRIIDQYHQISGWITVQKVTPELLCNVLRSKFDFHKLEIGFEDRLLVLEYALHNVPGNIANLYNVPLLPLENRQFTKFSHQSVEKIFIPSVKHSADLLPNMKHRLLYRTLSLQLQGKLNELGNSKATQLHHPTANDIKQLLWQNLPNDWSGSSLETVAWNPSKNGHPSLAWLELVWKWINENYPRDLTEFERMPLIPVTPSSMARLRQNSTTIVTKHPLCNGTLSDQVRDFLVKSDCVVVEKLPSFVKHDQLFSYVALPTPSGILKILSVAREKVAQQLKSASNKLKVELCSILSRLEGIDSSQKSFIRTLPIFEAVDGSHFVSCQTERGEQRLVAPRNLLIPAEFRIIDRSNILSSSKDENYRLLRKLEMKIESTAGLVRHHLENFLNSGISDVEKDKLMLWVLKTMDVLNQEMPAFVVFIRELACIPTASGKRIAPNKLFDHSDELLIRLLKDNNEAFPTNQFSELLRGRKNELNIRRRENVAAQDVLVIASRTPELSLDRGMALVELLNQRPQLLREYTANGSTLGTDLRNLPWLPRVTERPTNYPDFMPWYDGIVLCKPSNMQPDSLALLVGATVPVFNERLISPEVQDLLGMSHARNLLIKEIVEQLHLAVVSWTNQTTTKALMVAKFEEMVKSIYMYLCQAPRAMKVLLRSKGLTQWVWHGSGFASPEKVALESDFPKNINIYPYLYRLPNELFKVKDFLLSLGVKPQFTVDDLLDMLRNIKAKHDDKEQTSEEARQDFYQCRAVLEWIVRSGDELTQERRSKLLIPVHTTSEKLQLELCDMCTFCDREFLRRGISEHGISVGFHLIHKEITADLASDLQVPRLSSCLAKAKAIGIKFKEAGQYEPLTTRLHNILGQYKEGVAIFKELIQNADDAGASKVCFVVDWRENPREKLLAEELSKCHGPALWAYNDAMFSEKDFQNINKLAGETKKEELDKVGRFGLGFNSVYHLTDVPSFVSGEHVVIFDPNMNHISHLIDGKMRQGGLMLSFVENKDVLSAFPDQFSPYNQLFGCDMTGTGNFFFEGTLFRLPFRTSVQAQESEISKEPYTRENVNELMKSLAESAATLLLFAQNVEEVRVFEIKKNSTPKKSLGRPIITITKSVEKIVYTNITEGKILKNSSNWLLKKRQTDGTTPSAAPRRTELLKMNVSVVKCDLTGVSDNVQTEEMWLVNSCTGERSSLQVAQSHDGIRNAVVPVTGIAAKMTHSNIHGTKIYTVAGEVFCFMPLSIESGFPVHVNGSFSVHADRRRLWEKCVGEQKSFKPFEATWNEALMQDSLVQAYLQLLQILRSYNDKQYEFHSLWPNPTKVSTKAWKPLLDSFFNKIIDEEWPLFYCNGNWKKLQDCLILDPKLNKVAECVKIMNLLNQNVLSLPQHFVKGFESGGKAEFIKSHTLTEEKFLREFFFPNVSLIPNQLRNSVLLHILDRRLSKHRNYDDLLQTYPCFSCSNDGTLLRKPSELVHPKGKAAGLFSEEEKRFPLDDRFLERERALMLEELGMVIDSLPWRSLCERAEWVSKHCDVKKAGMLVQFMNRMPSQCNITEEETKMLRAAQFLPILSKPKDFPFSWKSDEYRTMRLAAADHLHPGRHKYLVGSFQLILDESSDTSIVPNRSVKKILGFTTKQPELSHVIAQLDLVIKLPPGLPRDKKEHACFAIYEFFQKFVTTDRSESQQLREQLESRLWMLVKNQMVDPKLVAKNWNKEDGAPYLFSLPVEYSTKFNSLIIWYGIKEKFREEDFIQAIEKLKADVGRRRLLDNQFRTLIVLLEELFTLSTDTQREVPLPLPSVDEHLYDADQLVINETPWLETDGRNKPVHARIPTMLAYKCGAKELRNADLTSCSEPIGQPFGQHENLTDRLKNILKAYPADEGILKELLQNADDAKANEIHFVFDPRTHGNKHVFSPNWKDLQGPAICVYNDKPFTKEDIEGIQKLGIGSKVDDPMKTGQYGIGFNAVYHLTDCPYFISDDEVICVSDPHTAYVPGADEKKPGRLFNQLTKRFRRNYEDVLSGFLGDRFKLERSTMFRFPLRRNAQLSKISTEEWNDRKVKKLFETFRHSAKDMLLFLNNVTKISVSEIKRDGELETYSVMCEVSDEGKRAEFFEKIKACSRVPTQGIQWQQIHYVMKITDTTNVKKDWLVTQSLGHAAGDGNSQVPDGTKMGLLPRAGIAIRLPSSESEGSRAPFRHFVFCVLPLPVYTKFPAHINGHFALDQARRGVWHDPKSSDERVVWNHFMKRHVIAPAYASAICHAREFIPGHQTVSYTSGVFPTKKETEDGLRWYHQLFPSITGLDAEWKPVGEALFKDFLSILPVLPVALSVPAWKKPREEIASRSTNAEAERDQTPVVVTWCDANNACFCTSGMSWLLEKTLVEIEFWLLSHTPWPIHESFKAVERCQEVSPVKVRDFLRNHRGINNRLPSDVKDTALHDVDSVNELTLYCVKAEDFFESLEGLPLLVTQDGVLRRFRTNLLVFCSRFGKLLPSRPDLFLHDRLRYRYDSDIEKCCGVVREFLLPDLAKFQAILFPSSWINTASHQPWNPNEEDNTFPSKTWLKLLWEFVDFVSKRSETSEILQEIVGWHIIPTTQNCLVPVSMSKTVLDVSTYLNSDSPQDKILRELLVKLGCPQLNHTLLISSSSRISSPTGATAVRKHYLAMVQSTKDVLGLLHQTVNGDMREEATLTRHEIERLLMFLQGDLERLSRSLLRNLPFYRTISTTYTRLSDNHAVFEVEDNVPKDDLQILSTVTNSIFLSSAPKLTDLYQHIGIKRASSVEFYMRVVLKYFNHLTPEGRVNHLMFVRDYLLHGRRDGYQALLSKMIQLPFIPDHSGVLRPAKEFYDTSNEVFAKFIIQEKFPPPPFDSAEWKEFLKKVGLQCDVTQEHFFTFATQLQEEACNPTSIQAAEIFQKSNILVRNLSANECLHALQFLSRISEIRFVRASSMIQFCLDIHPSYTTSILTCFRGSVVDSAENRALVWTSASLIPSSAVRYLGDNLIPGLGIHTRPPYELVISHVKNISGRFPASRNEEIPSTLHATLLDAMQKIYRYFMDSCNTTSGPSDTTCSPNCQLIKNSLRNVPVILVDSHTFVCGGQLAFKGVWNNLKPYMFEVPRHFKQYDHFLKCLGAQERPTPLQYATVLETIKKSCVDNKMHPGEVRAAVEATKCLFVRLSKTKKRSQTRGHSAPSTAQSLANVQTLYLPTEDDYLKPSGEVFVNDTMEKKERLKDYWKELLIDLTMKDQERPAKLVELLPNHVRVKKLSSILNEELSPSCIDQICVADQDPIASSCEFIKRYRNVICSREFSEALIRLYKAQEDTPSVPEEVINDLRCLENRVKVSCMQTIAVRLVKIATMEPVSGSNKEVPCFYHETPDGFRILIKHGGETNPGVLHERLSSFIAWITGQHIKEAYWRYFMMILGVEDAIQISMTLDDARVTSNSGDNREPKLGDKIPECYHDLLKHNIKFYLRDGEWVGYEVREEDEENEAVYVYAKIIEKTCPGDGRFAFNSKYKIDIGEEETIEVRKLKLYKFDREQRNGEADAGLAQEILDLVPYIGGQEPTPPDREPVTVEEAKREVAEELREIWQLPEEERRSCVRRLIRQWHPDRNPNRVALATEVTQYLLNEVERLEGGGVPGYQPDVDNANQPPRRPPGGGYRDYAERQGERARRQRQQREERRFYEDDTEPANRNEGERWMRQAEKDFDTANYLSRSEGETYYAYTCFQCQQAVEKALKAFMFAKGRLQRNDLQVHDVLALAYRASTMDPRLRGVPDMVRFIHEYYKKTRYPLYRRGNSLGGAIPAEIFTQRQANEALSNARTILQLVREAMD